MAQGPWWTCPPATVPPAPHASPSRGQGSVTPTGAASGAGTLTYSEDLGHKRSRNSRENCGLHWIFKIQFYAPNVQVYSQLVLGSSVDLAV